MMLRAVGACIEIQQDRGMERLGLRGGIFSHVFCGVTDEMEARNTPMGSTVITSLCILPAPRSDARPSLQEFECLPSAGLSIRSQVT